MRDSSGARAVGEEVWESAACAGLMGDGIG